MATNRLKGICIICLTAAAICQGPDKTHNIGADGIRIQKSSLGILPEADNELIVDILEVKYKEPGELTGNLANEAPASGSSVNHTAAGQSGTSGSEKVGPSMMSQIITQGELGTTQEPILGGAKLTLLQSQTDQQILSCIIQTAPGKLIVIDGGLGTDASNLLNQLRDRGGHVGAWLVTHPHGDHVGALYNILENKERNLTIDGIYYSLAEPNWYSGHDAADATMAHALINTLSQMPAEMLHGDIGKDYEFMVDDVKIQVMNNRYNISKDSGNNAGIVYKITVNGKSILFLGDMGEEGGKMLLADCGNSLKADIVQMAHHGQNGVNESVYQAINPAICLWPTPQWLWDNNKGSGINTGGWQTAATKGWMNRINASILHYASKDGDQTIE